MITIKDIYVGARIILNDPERPDDVPLKGTVCKIQELGSGDDYGYVASVLPDTEFMELPSIKDNTLYGLTNCFGFDMDLLPQVETPESNLHLLQKFNICIHVKDTNDILYAAFYKEIVSILDAYGYEINQPMFPGEAPEGIKGKNSIYCHPKELAGKCVPGQLDTIERMLRFATTFEIRSVKSKPIGDYDDNELLEQYHLKCDNTIRETLLTNFRTSSPDVYLNTSTVIKKLCEEIKIETLTNRVLIGCEQAETYLYSAFDELVKEGLIIIDPLTTGRAYITNSRTAD